MIEIIDKFLIDMRIETFYFYIDFRLSLKRLLSIRGHEKWRQLGVSSLEELLRLPAKGFGSFTTGGLRYCSLYDSFGSLLDLACRIKRLHHFGGRISIYKLIWIALMVMVNFERLGVPDLILRFLFVTCLYFLEFHAARRWDVCLYLLLMLLRDLIVSPFGS